MAPSPPAGIELLKGKTPMWRVGKKLGDGACATVHTLEELDGGETEWAIKLTPVPKKTKKQNSPEEKNYRVLYLEYVMYQNQFQDIQGIFVPRLPPMKPPPSGETEGYRYLVMERMEMNLFDIVPTLIKQSKSRSTVQFGPVAAQLLRCIEAIHERKHVVVDVKPENFMLVQGNGQGSTTVDKLASRIRILDLALVQPWASISSSHRSNDGTAGLAGTPLYASLNVHGGETLSRRDDLEALGYVLAELMMKLASGNASTSLPWSKGRSDDEIGGIKTALVGDENSTFYRSLGGNSVATIFKDYMDRVRSYKFKTTPNYDELADLLVDLRIPIPKVKSSSLNGEETAGKSAGKKRATRTSTNAELVRSESPKKFARNEDYMETAEFKPNARPTRKSKAAPIVKEDDEDDETFATAEMDWEPIKDENINPAGPTKNEAEVGLTIVVEDGPHRGCALNLVRGGCESAVIGRNPGSITTGTVLALPSDSEVDNAHIRLDLSITKKLVGVVVTDLKSSGSYVGNEKIRSGKDWKVFRGQKIRIGKSVLLVKTLDANNVFAAVKPSAATPVLAKSVKKGKEDLKEADETSDLTNAGKSKRVGVCIEVVDGPHRGDSVVLEKGSTESISVGSKPSGKQKEVLSLPKDKDLKANQIRIGLVIHKKYTAVLVEDKSGGTLVNRATVKKGRAFINDQIKAGNSVLQVKSL